MHEGICVGGPLDGLTYTIRNNTACLVVDKPAGLAWVYVVADDGRLVVNTAGSSESVDPVTGARTIDLDQAVDDALREGFDVIAAPDSGTGDEDVEGTEEVQS